MHAQPCPVPIWPRLLGAAGAVPFVALGALAWLPSAHQQASHFALVAYGAVILSFVGALHWGFAMTAKQVAGSHHAPGYVWSTVPSLLGWVALLLPHVIAVVVLLGGFWAHYLQDRRLLRYIVLPEWYLPLRFGLTSAASLGLLAGGLAML